MKSYPSIPHISKKHIGNVIYAFDKIDGSNIRVEYSKKRGFYKFGTRNVLLDEYNEIFGDAINIFLDKFEKDLKNIFNSKKYNNIQKITIFGEYFGESSFAGQHSDEEDKTIKIIDINLYKKGILNPKDFIKDFGHLDIPEVVYRGKLDNEFIQMVRNNKLDRHLEEGVVCKWVDNKKINLGKIKTKEWVDKVKSRYSSEAVLKEFNNDINIFNEYN